MPARADGEDRRGTRRDPPGHSSCAAADRQVLTQRAVTLQGSAPLGVRGETPRRTEKDEVRGLATSTSTGQFRRVAGSYAAVAQPGDGAAIEACEHGAAQSFALVRNDAVGKIAARPQRY